MGGPQHRSLSVAQKLRDHGIQVSFVAPYGDGDFETKARKAGFEVAQFQIPRIRSPKRLRENTKFLTSFLETTRSLHTYISSHPAEIVHVNGPLSFQAALAAKRSTKRLVWHFNDTLTPPILRQISSFASKRWADEIVVSADAVQKLFFSEDTITNTIYAPVDLREFNPERYECGRLRSELGVDEETTIIGSVGNLSPIKGHEYFLNALAELPNLHQSITAPIVGAPLDSRQQYYDQLKRQAKRLGLAETVQFLGHRDDVPALLADFDLFVLSSISEACPIVVLEAMAMNCPIIATDVGGVSEQIPDPEFGWVVPPKKPKVLAGAITEAIRNPEDRSRRARRAKSRVEEIFSIENCVDRHIKVYEKTLHSGQSKV